MMEEPRDSQQKSERIDATPVASRGGSWQRRSERQCDDASPSGSAEAPEEGGASREKSSGYKRRQGDDEAKNKRRKVDADTTVTAVVMNARGVASIPLGQTETMAGRAAKRMPKTTSPTSNSSSDESQRKPSPTEDGKRGAKTEVNEDRLPQDSQAASARAHGGTYSVGVDANESVHGDSEGVTIVKQMLAELKEQGESDPTLIDGWYNWLDDLLAHHATHGHCQVRDAENHILYSWLKRQRIMYRKGKLEPDKLRILQLLKTNGFDVPSGNVEAERPRQRPARSQRERSSASAKEAEEKHEGEQAEAPAPTRQPLPAPLVGELAAGAAAAGAQPQAPQAPGAGSALDDHLLQRLTSQQNSQNMATLLQRGGNAANNGLYLLPGVSTALQASTSSASSNALVSGWGYPNVLLRQPREDAPGHVAGAGIDRIAAASDALGSSQRPGQAASLLERSLGALTGPDPLRRLQQPEMNRRQSFEQQQQGNARQQQALLLLLQRQQQQRQQQQRQQQFLLDELLRRQLQGRDRDNRPS